jgi:hypothetical protein
MKHLYLLTFLVCVTQGLFAQNNSNPNARVTGNLQSNGNFFISDPRVGASNTPQYDYQKFGAETWMNLNYSNWGFDFGLRFDMFNNSNLLNPTGSYSDEGIGRWYVHKNINKFEFTGGYIYDQIGSGIIFRAYEERALMIDQALKGIKVGYNFNDNWRLKAFTGRMKRQFDEYTTVVRGGALDGFFKLDSASSVTFAPGIGVVARTYSEATVNQIANTIATYPPQDSIGVQFNTYAASLYNTMTAGNFTWYAEGAVKSDDVMYNPFEPTATGGTGKLINEPGYTVYSSLTYAQEGLGITLEGKRTDNFAFRNSPDQIAIQGTINFLPPMARQNTYRLTTRFAPATQELGEQALQLDAKYAINKRMSVGFNFSDIYLLDGTEIYREIAPEFTYKKDRKWQVLAGVQLLKYNIFVYQAKRDEADDPDILGFLASGDADYVEALTPYTEFLYKLSAKQSIRVEAQYLRTDDEFGSWLNGLVEFGWAPHWLIYVSDMYKLKHDESKEYSSDKTKFDGIHFPSMGVVYTYRANRFSFAYVKQVEGINCAGGICRYEPAFNGFRLNVNSSF